MMDQNDFNEHVHTDAMSMTSMRIQFFRYTRNAFLQ